MAISQITSAIKRSFSESVGDIIFGMEDGTVSIFGLVFGVAVSSNSSATVLLAGATGAIAAAVSMMAGAYLDAASTRASARAKLAHERWEIRHEPGQEAAEATQWLQQGGFTPSEMGPILQVLEKHPESMLKLQSAFELEIGRSATSNPIGHATWMFVSDLFAASVPIIPFALLPLAQARIVSIIVTALLLIVLGVGRAVVGHENMLKTVLETLGIASAAAIAGVLVGKLISSWTGI